MGVIVSLLVSIIVPDLEENVCDALTDTIANFEGINCGECSLTIGGIFSIEAEAITTCALSLENAGDCEATVIGGGGAFDVVFGGDGLFVNIDADCDVDGFASLGANVEGSFSIGDGVNIGTCEIDVDVDGEAFGCTCDDDCGDAFSAQATCTRNGSEFFTSDCINVLEIISEVQTAIEGAQNTD